MVSHVVVSVLLEAQRPIPCHSREQFRQFRHPHFPASQNEAMRLLLLLGLLLASSEAKVALRHLGTEYLPIAYGDSSETFAYNMDVAEQMAFDPSNNYIYVVGVDLLQIIDFSNPVNLRRVNHFQFPDKGEATDVETCGDLVAVSYDNDDDPLEGKVFIFKKYDGAKIEEPQVVKVGSLPDMVKFTHDCGRLLVAMEGELKMVDGEVTDPEGGVVIITFTDGIADPSPVTLDFKKFNEREDEYLAKGVRRSWRGENSNITTTFSQDLEPEYIAIDDEDTRAYVVLQENNAVAVVDLTVPEIMDIYPLGQKQWLQEKMDPSDADQGIRLGNWDIYGLYQPDGIKLVTIGGTQYLLTADEGDVKGYNTEDYGFEWSDAMRGKTFVTNNLTDDSVSEDMKDHLNDDAKLGRLKLSIVDGKDPSTGNISAFYSFGGRSFSLYDVSDFSQAYTSGDLLEFEIASQFPKVFNSNPGANDESPEDAKDRRSDKRGPEPEAVDYAELELSEGEVKKLIFLGMERPGFLAIFRVTDDFPGPGGISMESMQYSGGYGQTYEELWKDRVARDLDPEDIKVLPADRSPNGKPLLAVAGAITGTLSLYEIFEDEEKQSTVTTSTSTGTEIPSTTMTGDAHSSTGTPSSSVTPKNQNDQNGSGGRGSSGLSKGAIVGLVAACACVVTLIVLALFYFFGKRKHVRLHNEESDKDELTL